MEFVEPSRRLGVISWAGGSGRNIMEQQIGQRWTIGCCKQTGSRFVIEVINLDKRSNHKIVFNTLAPLSFSAGAISSWGKIHESPSWEILPGQEAPKEI